MQNFFGFAGLKIRDLKKDQFWGYTFERNNIYNKLMRRTCE